MNWYQELPNFFAKEQRFIAENYPDMHFQIRDEFVTLVGVLRLNAQIKDSVITDSYKILIIFPHNYPTEAPIAFETSEKIPQEFHHLSHNKLCLGTPIEINSIFSLNKTIRNYLEKLLIPYLLQFSYKTKYGIMPFGERSHGIKGIYEFYEEKIGLSDNSSIVKFLLSIKDKKINGKKYCPCGSNLSFWKCHMKTAKILMDLPVDMIINEIEYLLKIQRFDYEERQKRELYQKVIYNRR